MSTKVKKRRNAFLRCCFPVLDGVFVFAAGMCAPGSPSLRLGHGDGELREGNAEIEISCKRRALQQAEVYQLQ
jgi:hypothetical protein